MLSSYTQRWNISIFWFSLLTSMHTYEWRQNHLRIDTRVHLSATHNRFFDVINAFIESNDVNRGWDYNREVNHCKIHIFTQTWVSLALARSSLLFSWWQYWCLWHRIRSHSIRSVLLSFIQLGLFVGELLIVVSDLFLLVLRMNMTRSDSNCIRHSSIMIIDLIW